MRILHVIDSLEPGGAEKLVIYIANEWVKRGYKTGVMVIVERGSMANLLDNRVELIELNRISRLSFRSLKKFSIIASRFDIVHVHLIHNFKYAFVADVFFGLPSKIVLHDHSGQALLSRGRKSKIPVFMLNWMRKHFYLAVSNALLEHTLKLYHLQPGRYAVLSNAVPIYSNLKLGVKPSPGSPIRLLLVGNVRPIKNIEFAIYFVSYMLELNRHVQLTIVGKISDEKYYNKLRNLINQLGLQDYVYFKGPVNSISELNEQFNLGIHCSHAETGPIVLLEYMMMGLPFIAANKGDISLIVKDKVPEVILNDFEFGNWQNALDLITYNYDIMVKKIYNLFLELNSFEKYISSLNQIYLKC